jgi:Rrf2 family protein
MSLSSLAIKGLHAVGIIAAHSKQHPVPTTTLARHIGLSVSSTEIVARKLRSGGLIHANRGPGGGYRLRQPVEHLTVWDVVSYFKDNAQPTVTEHGSPEREAVVDLANQLDQAVCNFLQAYPLADVLKQLPADEPKRAHSRSGNTGFQLKPFRQSAPPLAPSWVFDLAKFSGAAHA